MNKDFEGSLSHKEKWYGIEYSTDDFTTKSNNNTINTGIYGKILPHKNQYIPRNTDLKS